MAASEINEKRRFRKEKMKKKWKRGKGKEKGENFMVKGPSFLEYTLGKK